MRVELFDYDLPEHLIAQRPTARRDESRLMLIDRVTGAIAHHRFHDLPKLLDPKDLLVLNNTRVIPARLLGRRAATGGKWEGLYLQTLADGAWELLSQSRGRLRPDEHVIVEHPYDANCTLSLTMIEQRAGRWIARAESDQNTLALLEQFGHVPLPPYVRKGRADTGDWTQYQTIYAERAGAVAAPTAGLHFTAELLERLRCRGIEQRYVTLHVGIGTFQPVKVDEVEQHQMHEEWGELPKPTVEAIESCRARGGRVIAVGTTTVRVLETVASQGDLKPWSGLTDLFIYPPYDFRVIDGLITNFHLPRSSLLMLVGAFLGREWLLRAYQTAIVNKYRFYSYGDGTLIL